MPAEIILQQTPNAAALPEERERLAAVRNKLAERESELAQLRAQLTTFEGRYLRQVGILYAELDELEGAHRRTRSRSVRFRFRTT